MKNLSQLFFVCALCASIFSFGQSTQKGDSLLVETREGFFVYDTNRNILTSVSGDLIPATVGVESFVEKTSPINQSSVILEYETRQKNGVSFRWWHMSVQDRYGTQTTLFDFDSRPDKESYIWYHFAWGAVPDVAYFSAERGDGVDNHQGIYEYNVKTKAYKKILSKDQYFEGFPLVNTSKTSMFFLGPDQFGGNALYQLDLASLVVKPVVLGVNIASVQWIQKSKQMMEPPCNTDFGQPLLRSPFLPSMDFCVTRAGANSEFVNTCSQACSYNSNLCSPAVSCEGHCSAGCFGCRDAYDFDSTPLDAWDDANYIVSSGMGYVILVRANCPLPNMGLGYGFGYHVVIRLGLDPNDLNAPEILYAHLSEIYVSEGDLVQIGQIIGQIGNTQTADCNGDGILDCDCTDVLTSEHLHYEYHNGMLDLYSTQDIMMPKFADIGNCVPQSNNSYVAGNTGYNFDDYANSSFNSSLTLNCDGISVFTITGTTCECCYSWWDYQVDGETFTTWGDTLVIPVIPELYGLSPSDYYFYISRSLYDPCTNTTSVFSEIGVAFGNVYNQCSAVFGCTDSNACNFNPNATDDNGLCDYDCYQTSNCSALDFNQNGIIDLDDMLTLVGSFGTPNADVNGDGATNFSDLFILMNSFGMNCP